MSKLSGRESVPGMNGRKRGKWKEKTTRSSRELHGTYGMATDHDIMEEEMSKLSGQKSVPGMNSCKKGKWKERVLGFHVSINSRFP
nr:hypothetical protein [Tanacetum cinerariifolium]